MAKLKEKMTDLKKKLAESMQDTPKRVQWLLMAAAFVLVLILLTLLFGGADNKKADINDVEKAVAEIKIDPDIINWAEVLVGDKKTQEISITASTAVNILGVNNYTEINGLSIKQNCTVIKPINKTIGCKIFLEYEPTAVQPVTNVSLFVEWHDTNEPLTMKKESKIVLTLGAQAPEKEPVQMPIIPVSEPEKYTEPAFEPAKIEEPEFDDEPEFDYAQEPEPEPMPEPIKENIKKSVDTLAPAIKPTKKQSKKEVEIVIPDGCSDFAFPAYGTSGKQIGWVKPSGGAYYYHPFSDKDCKNAEGTYNPDNGIITDDSGKKIGTDAEHIGLSVINSGILPELTMKPAVKQFNRAVQNESPSVSSGMSARISSDERGMSVVKKAPEIETEIYLGSGNGLLPSVPYDRQFILRQYKPIPATIVSEVRADPEALRNSFLPVRATVDRNVYSDAGRNVIIPAGTLMLGYVTGKLPGPYASIGRMQIKWYQFILPNGMEYNFKGDDSDPFSGDAQGREGVLGRGSTDYLEQFFMPMLTAFVPAAINLINPVADAFVNQIDLDNNTVVQSGTVRSSELAKSEIISAWNQVAQKLMLDMLDSSVPPFTIAAGTRITVYSPQDLVASCGETGGGKKCSLGYKRPTERADVGKRNLNDFEVNYNDGTWQGQSRSFNAQEYCVKDENGIYRVKDDCIPGNTNANGVQSMSPCGGYSYTTLKLWCESMNYESKKALQYKAYTDDQKQQYQNKIQELGGKGTQQFNEEILGVQYNDDGSVVNPYEAPVAEVPAAEDTALTCMDGSLPDENGCCAGEIYTDMGEMGFNCCPEAGGDCFPPLL